MVVEENPSSFFAGCSLAPPDPILNLSVAFKKDQHPKKVDLGVGAYRDDSGKPYVFKAVKLAEQAVQSEPQNNHEYTTIEGPALLKSLCVKVLIGDRMAQENESRIVSAQTISGTGALRVAAEFIALHCGNPVVYVSDPTWGNHNAIFAKAGLAVHTYPYWNDAEKNVNVEAWIETLETVPRGSVILLHACAHNPTGCDPEESDVKRIVEVISRRHLLAVADTAYQGYASGDLEKDSFMMRELLASGAEFIITQSFAKNMGLYGERFGMVHIVTKTQEIAEKTLSQLKLVIRPMYSSPPIHGGKIALKILSDPELYNLWLAELKQVSGRINHVRSQLADGLTSRDLGVDWSHIKTQIGMFSYTGLSPSQVDKMISKWHVYMMRNGRISLAGLNESNIQYVIDAIDDCVRL